MHISGRSVFGLTLAGAFAAGLVFPTVARAQSGVVEALPPSSLGSSAVAPAGQAPDLAQADALISPDAFAAVVDLNERIEPHLYVDAAGLVRLGDVTAAQLGVTEKFLADYRAALEYSNEAITAGHIVVHPDLTVETTESLSGDFDVRGPALPADASATGAAPQGAVPQWGAWGYPSGAIFFNTYSDWTYYRTNYYGLCNTMGAYLGLPWMSRSLVYFYGYNQMYFSRYCYNPMGVYYYMPYSYCQTGFGYKPAYFWARTYAYSYGCGCYQYQWAWQGYWARY
jgi:hypothetical protein